MADFQTLIKKVSRKLQDPDNTAISVAVVGDAINQSIRTQKKSRFYFNNVLETVTLNIGDPILPVTLPKLLFLVKDGGLFLANSPYTYYSPLQQKTNTWYDINFPISGSGIPYAYTWRAGQYLLYYTPDQAYTIKISGVRDYDDLVNPTDSNDFTIEAQDLIYHDTLRILSAEERTDPTMSDYYEKEVAKDRTALFGMTNQILRTGTAKVYW